MKHPSNFKIQRNKINDKNYRNKIQIDYRNKIQIDILSSTQQLFMYLMVFRNNKIFIKVGLKINFHYF